MNSDYFISLANEFLPTIVGIISILIVVFIKRRNKAKTNKVVLLHDRSHISADKLTSVLCAYCGVPLYAWEKREYKSFCLGCVRFCNSCSEVMTTEEWQHCDDICIKCQNNLSYCIDCDRLVANEELGVGEYAGIRKSCRLVSANSAIGDTEPPSESLSVDGVYNEFDNVIRCNGMTTVASAKELNGLCWFCHDYDYEKMLLIGC